MELELIRFSDYEKLINWHYVDLPHKNKIQDLRKSVVYWHNKLTYEGASLLQAIADGKDNKRMFINFKETCTLYNMTINNYSKFISEVVNINGCEK